MSWSRTERRNVDELIRSGRYAQAEELVRAEVAKHKADVELRILLGDVLARAGKREEAGDVLMNVADEFAIDGKPARAIAMLKRVEKLTPRRSEIGERMAQVIKQRDRPSASGPWAVPAVPTAPEVSVAAEVGDPIDLDLSLDLTAEDLEANRSDAAAELLDRFDEGLLASVINGLDMHSHPAGDVIVTEGEPGDSLFVVTVGVVKAWVKDATGRNRFVREVAAGDFFGEIALLDGSPRSATITTATAVDLLELDRAAVDTLARSHPELEKRLREFYEERKDSALEAAVRAVGRG